MFLNDDLLEAILLLISERGAITGSDIIPLLQETRSVSRAQIYRGIKKLTDREILVKTKPGEYMVNFYWLAKLTEYIDSTSQAAMGASSFEFVMPNKGEAIRKKFRSFRSLLNYWNHCLALMLRYGEDEHLYSWIPHPWYSLIPQLSLSSYVLSQKNPECKIFTIVGDDSFLDRWNKQEEKDRVKVSYDIGPFEGQNSLYFDMRDSFIVSLKFDKRSTELIDTLYEEVGSMSQENYKKIQEFIDTPIRATLIFENNSRKAKQYNKMIKAYWNIEAHN